MCGKNNNGLGLDFGGDVLAYTLQFFINWMIKIIHDVRLCLSARDVLAGTRTARSKGTSWKLTYSTVGKATMGSQREISRRSTNHSDEEATHKKTGVLTAMLSSDTGRSKPRRIESLGKMKVKSFQRRLVWKARESREGARIGNRNREGRTKQIQATRDLLACLILCKIDGMF